MSAKHLLAALGLAASFVVPAFAAGVPVTIAKTDKGGIFVNDKGMTLYTFAKDSDGKSVCNDKCASNWPPLAAHAGDAGPAGWSVIKRDDGAEQWAYKGKPLYTFAKDTKPGDTMGDGFLNGAWHVAMP